MKGAEAVLSRASFLGVLAVKKLRVEKRYRPDSLDREIRAGRTKREARLLAKAKEAGVLCPTVFSVDDFCITMKLLEGEMLYFALKRRRISAEEIKEAAEILVRLHSANIIHGDYTPANLMNTKDGMAVIDFGLGSISCDIEDKATDIVTMKKALGADGGRFVLAYLEAGGQERAAKMVSEIENRARYMRKGI
jgi:Kae1-associated kinase Bud32